MSHANGSPNSENRERQMAMILLFVVPVLFSTNIITARAVSNFTPPFALAFWRSGAGRWHFFCFYPQSAPTCCAIAANS